MDIILTLTTVGTDQGVLFDLYSDVDGYTSAFETDVPLASLLAGYTTTSAPDNTIVVRICGQEASCSNCVDIRPVYTTTTTTTLVPFDCEELVSSSGAGITEYYLPLDEGGGVLTLDFNAYGSPDKCEIIHGITKMATSGMTVANSGPFDDLYGDPTEPNNAQVMATDQFIGTAKGIIPTRDAAYFSETGLNITANGQQLIWWVYDSADVIFESYVTVRITGESTTSWDLQRRCLETTTTTTSTSSTTTTTTTAAPTTTTTTTLTGLDEANISDTTSLGVDCSLLMPDTVYIDTQTPGTLTTGDIVFTGPGGGSVFIGNGDYYHIDLDGIGTEFSARINAFGEILGPISFC